MLIAMVSCFGVSLVALPIGVKVVFGSRTKANAVAGLIFLAVVMFLVCLVYRSAFILCGSKFFLEDVRFTRKRGRLVVRLAIRQSNFALASACSSFHFSRPRK